MSRLKHWQNKIKEKRKKTQFKEFLLEIGAWYPLVFHKYGNLISRHPDQRHLDRMTLRNPRKLFERKCDKCGVDMKTTYASERSETVYCEKCYAITVY